MERNSKDMNLADAKVGEEYIVNDYGEYVHYECVDYARKMAEFLGYDIKEMCDGEY